MKKVPKFDGRPMLWLTKYGELEIRYGATTTHKMSGYVEDSHVWVDYDGWLTPSELVEFDEDFLGYL